MLLFYFFFFKQKTAYEMRISDWSSDLCSSDLPAGLDLADDAMTLADALVYDAPGEAGEAHWNEEAKALIAGILLWVACDTESQGSDRTLEALRDCLTFAPANFQRMLRELSRHTQESGRGSCRERRCRNV